MKTADQNNQRGMEGLLSARGSTLALRVLAFLLALLTAAAAVAPILATAALIGSYLIDLVYPWIGLDSPRRAEAVWAAIEGWHLLCVPVAILSGVGARVLVRKTAQAP